MIHKDDRDQMQLFDDNETADVSAAQKNVKTDQDDPGETENTDDEAIVDPRNALNDLTGKEWLPETKSFFFQKGLGAKHPHAQIERQHPAPFSFQDISRLILFSPRRGKECLIHSEVWVQPQKHVL